jgi:hypothetical protein
MTLRVPRELEWRNPAAEARRQSLTVSGRESEKDALRFIEGAADVRGWR